MDVVLLQRIESLGQMGDVVKVKPGFARNYLLPQKKALRATKDNLARFEGQRAQLEATNLEKRSEAEQVSGKLDGITVVIVRQAGETGHLYGSVTARDIAEVVTGAGFTVVRSQVMMDRPIKMLGLHPVRVALHPEVVVTVTVNVAKSEEEADIQLEAGGFVSPAEAEAKELAAEAEAEAAAEAERAAARAERAAARAEKAARSEGEPAS
jgi:large subunit ribosomal protein L9